jgi:glyoxylase-like metal-dependent hydrolase (beta-lactamase superfamily II)/rhodanese-related sulfurtransferase
MRKTMQTITVEALRSWLEEGHPVSMVDVRPQAERQEWAIPGSLHLDAYAALRAHDPEALAALELPADRPVVTVCAAGNTSQIAAEQLAARGLQVFSLEGGMQAWSLAWNTAEVPLADSPFQVIQLRRTGKGCLSYLIGAAGEATVIDASLDPQVYRDLAAGHGWRITRVLDTHIHADHLSRSRQLAEQSGASLFLPAQHRAQFPFSALGDGETLTIAGRPLTALHTPGHTAESLCYLLDGSLLFTGDTLFLSSVGRPDLAASPEEARRRTHLLYQSLHRLLTLPAATVILPGHTAAPVPFDRVPLMATLASVEERIDLLRASQADFAQTILSNLPATPANYQRIVALNEQGVQPDEPVTGLEAGANRCAIV